MEDNNFDWYEDIVELEVEEFRPVDKSRASIGKFAEVICYIFNFISIGCLSLFLIRYIFKMNKFYIFDINFNTILLALTVFCGSLSLIMATLKFFNIAIKALGMHVLEKRIKTVTQWASFSLWFIGLIYYLNIIKKELGLYYPLLRSFVVCGVLTSVSYTIVVILMQYFYEYFLQKSLKTKIENVDKSERMIAIMKNYRYEISDSSSTQTRECNCLDIFKFGDEDVDAGESNGSHIELGKKVSASVGELYFKSPEIQGLYDAKTIAKDVFLKASTNDHTLTFNDFSSIFPNTQIALQAFVYFETDDNKEIHKKEFRDVIIQFYMDRVNLEKSFEIAKGFVDLVHNLFSIIVFVFLFMAYLVIFGIPLKDLLALALSSALLLNFMASGLAVDIYYSFMVLLSHPFDIGDQIIIDNIDYTVYKTGLSSTAFLGCNGGKIEFLNSALWQKTIINMTRAPEKILVFKFTLDPNLTLDQFKELKINIHQYLKGRPFEFYEAFFLEALSEMENETSSLKSSLILKCKSFKTKSKKFQLRVEITKFLNDTFEKLKIKTL